MPWKGPDAPGIFPTLGYLVAELIEARCVIPDGDRVGDPFLLTDEQFRFLLWHYRLTEHGGFYFDRGSQLVRSQKWGKGPLAAAICCAEADPDGPVRFAGWDARGEPVGMPWATPLIQVTAVSEDQTGNVWRCLVPMIELGALAADIPDTGETRINLPGGGRIEPVTSAARSRLGQRITFAVQDQTESWFRSNGGRALADNQRRNLAGMGGRFIETPNAWDPAEESVAQQTSEAAEPGVHLDDVEPGNGSIRNKAERRRMLKRVYGDSWIDPQGRRQPPGWVDLDRIDSEIVALLGRDPAQAERWFLNRKRAAEDVAFDAERWAELADPTIVVPDRTLITLGVDGARFEDALAVVATTVESGHQFAVGIWQRPESAPDDYEHPAHEVDGAVTEAHERWSVWRQYDDPQWIEGLHDKLAGPVGGTQGAPLVYEPSPPDRVRVAGLPGGDDRR